MWLASVNTFIKNTHLINISLRDHLKASYAVDFEVVFIKLLVSVSHVIINNTYRRQKRTREKKANSRKAKNVKLERERKKKKKKEFHVNVSFFIFIRLSERELCDANFNEI